MKYNCVNCGAPIDYELTKCPYCGTYYYDLSEMTVGEVAALRVNIPGKGKVFAKAILSDFNVSADYEEQSAYMNGNAVTSFITSQNISADLKFNVVANSNGELLTIVKESEG